MNNSSQATGRFGDARTVFGGSNSTRSNAFNPNFGNAAETASAFSFAHEARKSDAKQADRQPIHRKRFEKTESSVTAPIVGQRSSSPF